MRGACCYIRHVLDPHPTRSMALRLCVFRHSALVAAVLAALSTANSAFAAPGETFTPKERAQGFRDRVILAKPRASHRATAESEETRERVRVREKFARFGDLRVVELDGAESVEAA